MATSIISNTIKDPAGNNIPNVRVVARIHPHPAFRTVAGTEIAPVVETITDANGQWSLALERTADITPSGTYYEIIEYTPDQKLRHLIQVGASNQSLYAALITVPPAGDLAAYLTQAAGDARYQQIGALGGSALNVDTAASNGVSTAAARVDHVHKLSANVAGNGLVLASGILAVGAGTGISVAADAVAVNLGDAAVLTAGTFTPQLNQNGNRTSSTAIGRYFTIGKMCYLHIRNVASAAGSAANGIRINNIPAAIAPLKTGQPNGVGDTSGVGGGYVLDNGTAYYPAHAYFSNSTTINFYNVSGTLGIEIGVNPNFALASGDAVGVDIIYELA